MQVPRSELLCGLAVGGALGNFGGDGTEKGIILPGPRPSVSSFLCVQSSDLALPGIPCYGVTIDPLLKAGGVVTVRAKRSTMYSSAYTEQQQNVESLSM
jgi:hypothetical protein